MFLINLAGLALIVLIIWWFWLYKPATVQLEGPSLIVVEHGVYAPARIEIPAGSPTALKFLRKDSSPCAATVQIPDLEISEDLPLGSERSIALPSMQPGEYPFHCQMQMYRGVLVVI